MAKKKQPGKPPVEKKEVLGSPPGRIERGSFLEKYGLSEEDYAKSGLDWTELEWIAYEHRRNTQSLSDIADYIAARLRQVPEVHSLKFRIKDPEHLIEKIIRKKNEKPALNITRENYASEVTDLIGIRALHLLKDDWLPIHRFVTTNWERGEKPTANIRTGDLENLFKEQGCKIKPHPQGYRSVHYLLYSQPTKERHIVELQVRTLFEEGWSEIDHKVQYLHASNNPVLAQYLSVFNRLAGSADEMGSLVMVLQQELRMRLRQKEEWGEVQRQLAETQARLQKTISELDISEQKKEELQGTVEKMRGQGDAFNPFGTFNLFQSTSPEPSSLLHTGFQAIPGAAFSIFSISADDRICHKCGNTYQASTGVAASCPNCGFIEG